MLITNITQTMLIRLYCHWTVHGSWPGCLLNCYAKHQLAKSPREQLATAHAQHTTFQFPTSGKGSFVGLNTSQLFTFGRPAMKFSRKLRFKPFTSKLREQRELDYVDVTASCRSCTRYCFARICSMFFSIFFWMLRPTTVIKVNRESSPIELVRI